MAGDEAEYAYLDHLHCCYCLRLLGHQIAVSWPEGKTVQLVVEGRHRVVRTELERVDTADFACRETDWARAGRAHCVAARNWPVEGDMVCCCSAAGDMEQLEALVGLAVLPAGRPSCSLELVVERDTPRIQLEDCMGCYTPVDPLEEGMLVVVFALEEEHMRFAEEGGTLKDQLVHSLEHELNAGRWLHRCSRNWHTG